MKFTFIMPIYNSEDILYKSINSIKNQTNKNWELIAVDDGSTDNTYKELKKIALKDKRIKIYTKKNSGPGKTRNYAMGKATGDYLAFIDSDDYYELDFLENINLILEKENYDLIFINTINEKNSGKIDYCDNIDKYSKCTKKQLIKLQMTGKLPWGPCSKVVKREIAQKCSFSSISVGEEAIYSFDVLEKSETIYFLKKPMYHYVHNDNGQHTRGGLDPWKNVVESIKNHLEKRNLYMEYEDALNTLALNSTIMSAYRISNSLPFKEAYYRIKEKVKEYRVEFDFKKINAKLLSNSSKILCLLLKIHFYFIIIIMSKIRKKFK